jgi:autotransporter-associated beta strand protein
MSANWKTGSERHKVEVKRLTHFLFGRGQYLRILNDRFPIEPREGCTVTDRLPSAAVERPGIGLSTREQLNGRMAALLATTALVAAAALLPGAARAQDATWAATPGSGDFNSAANWSPAAVPTGTAFFDASGVTSLSFSAGTTTVGGWTFNAGASAYSFANGQDLEFNGAGIVINGGSASISNNGNLHFTNSSTAGSASITNTSGSMVFLDTSTAGSASITNNGILVFSNASTAGNATITTTTNSGGSSLIVGSASGGTARFILNGGGSLDIAGLATGGTTAGSIEGTGNVFLGSKNLAVGGNNLSTTFSGVIQDGFSGGTGGSLTKTGTGTLTLSGVNTYSGATTVEAGTLRAGGAGAFVGNTAYAVNGGTLDLNGFSLTMSSLSGTGGTVALGAAALAIDQATDTSYAGAVTGTGSLTKTGTGTLTLSGANTYTGATTVDGGTLAVSGSLASSSISLTATGFLLFQGTGTAGRSSITNNSGLEFSDSSTAGGASITNNSGLAFLDTSTAGNASITNNGAVLLNFANSSTAGSASITNNTGASLSFSDTSTAGNATITNSWILQFFGASTAGDASITNNIGMAFNDTSTAGSATITNTGTLAFFNTSTAGSASITTNSGGRSFIENGASGGIARFILNGTGLLDISALSITGTTAGSIEGAGNVFLGSKNLAVGGNNLSTTFSGVVQDGGLFGGTGGSLTKTGTGTLTLSGANAYTGATTVDAGTLAVNGSIASSSLLTVNAGGTLGGNGIVGTTVINGGALAPGNSIGLLTVQGSLVFTAASSYMVEVSGVAADRANVSGAATLAGTVQVASPTNSFRFNSPYTILTSSGLGGTQFNALTTPAGTTGSLIYSGNNVLLNLASGLGQLNGLNTNQRAVGAALDAAFNANGNSGGLGGIFAGNVAQNLTQASGETATGTQQTTFDAMNLFMGVLTDPSIAGRGDGVSSSSGAPQFADENDYASAYADHGKPRIKSERDAYAAIYRKAPPMAETFTQRWSVWAAGYGGSQTTDGNAALGSTGATSRIAGTAVGADYRFSPFTLAGFALAGGGTNFSVNGSGSGRSDLFQAGAFIRHTVGPAYISGALAYGWQDITTDRTVTIAGVDQLRAKFNANAYSGRVEGGYRFVSPWIGGIGLTPYAAGQFTTFDLPAYAEQVLSGANTFALGYGSKSVTDTRSELGLRTDKSFAMQDSILTLRGRFAWAHDFNPDRNIAATFQTLPGASFVVNGAAQASDSALTTASAELKWRNGWSAAATFEGEFSDVTRSYAGKGVVRYAW